VLGVCAAEILGLACLVEAAVTICLSRDLEKAYRLGANARTLRAPAFSRAQSPADAVRPCLQPIAAAESASNKAALP
jgi:hypothetical protein